MKTIYLMLLSFFISAQVLAGGFQLNEHSAKAMAMGGAYTAISDDPSAIYFNPAGLIQLNGTQFMIGTALIAPSTTFRGVTPSTTEYKIKNQYFFPTHIFAAHKFNNNFAAGIGFTSPFGLGTKWDDNWVGKYLVIETDLKVFTISPVLAFRLTNEFSISAGFIYSFANVTITRKIPQSPFPGDALVRLEGDDNSAFGYNFGVIYKPTKKLSLGASFHSEINYKFKGTASSDGAPQLAALLPSGNITAELTTPINLAFGIAYDVSSELKLSTDFQYVGWSSYDSLKVDFENPAFPDIASPREYKNSYIIRLGGEYKLSDKFSAMGGIYFDKNPVEKDRINPSLPDADRLGFSLGFSYQLLRNLSLDFSYLFLHSSEITIDNSLENYMGGNSPFNGTYKSNAHIVSLSLSIGL